MDSYSRLFKLTFLTTFFCLSASTVTHAQSAAVIDQILRQQDSVVGREQQQRDNQRQRVEQQRQRSPAVELTPLEKLQGDSKACVEIKKLELEGVKAANIDKVSVEVRSFEGKCLTIVDIQNALRVVTNYYIEKGYITSRAYLAPQDLSSGVLKILIIEGGVERIQILENENDRNGGAQLFGKRRGKILNIRDFEQGMDQINRLGSKDAKIRIVPGKQVGSSVIFIDVEDAYDVSIYSGVDNNGSLTTGHNQWNTSVTAEDIFNAYESLTFSARTSLDKLQQNIFSRSYSGFLTVPYRDTTLNLSGSFSNYRSELVAPSQVFSFTGTSFEARTAVDHVLHRNQKAITKFGAGLILKENRNFVEGNFIETSSQRLTIVEVSLARTGQLLGGASSLKAAVKRGLDVFGAQSDDIQPVGTPSAQFTEFELSADYRKYWQYERGALGFVSNSFFSASGTTLFASERLFLGSLSTVRGFRDFGLAGDVGGYSQVELNWSLAKAPWNGVAKRVFGVPQFFAAIDNGYIFDDKTDESEGGQLTGASIGLRMVGGHVSAELAYEKPLVVDAPFKLKNKNGFVRFVVGAGFKF